VPRDLARIGLALAPPILRRPLMKPYVLRGVTWLTPAGRRELVRFSRTQDAAEPRRWDRHLAAFARSRHLRVIAHSLDLLGRARGVEVVHPLLDDGFLAALARAGGAAGFGARNDVMRAVFGGLLPDELLTRVGKAEFGRALWRSQARAFAEQWNGEGVDTELVDPERLREQWRAENPLFGSATLLHMTWLASRPPC
jgi:asparagine synthase (glutamine-hydrolysing)